MYNNQTAKKRSVTFMIPFSLICLILVFCFPGTLIASSQSMNKLIEGAKKEGQINYYASMNITEATAMIKGFEKKYPFLKVQMLRLGSQKLLTKVLTEYRMNKHSADVLQTVEFSMHTLIKKGVLGNYLSTENRFYPAESKEEGYWISPYCNPYVVAYNTRLVSNEDRPKTYHDLLDPKWKGKMMMDPTKLDWFVGMLQILGKEKGLDFMRKLSKQDIMYRRGHTLIGQLISAGEKQLQLNTPSSTTERIKQQGAPIDWVALGPVPGIMIGIGIAAAPPHPNAARLYKDYMLSKEAQTVLRDFGRTSLRSDIARPSSSIGLKIEVVNPALGENLNEYSDLMNSIFSGTKTH